MIFQLSTAVRNAQADDFESTIGAAPTMELRTGALPANCAAASSGTLLLQQALPSDWLTAASNGTKAKNGTWSLTALPGITPANAGHFRIFTGATCHAQGDITVTAGGGAMELDNILINPSQTVIVNTFNYTRGNA